MATLYVENIPEDLYDALRERARQHRKSIAAEVLALLQQNLVTPAEQKARKLFLRQAQRLRNQFALSSGNFPATEQMQREDRGR